MFSLSVILGRIDSFGHLFTFLLVVITVEINSNNYLAYNIFMLLHLPNGFLLIQLILFLALAMQCTGSGNWRNNQIVVYWLIIRKHENYIYTYLEQHWICKIAYSLLHSWWQHFNKCEKKCYSRLEESLKELKLLPANVFFKNMLTYISM